MNANGARKTISVAIRSEWFATATRKRCRRTAAGGRRRTTDAAPKGTLAVLISARGSRVMHPAARVPEDHRGGRDVRLREVLEPVDHPEDDREQDHGADRRERHPAQPPQRPDAVELRRLVEVLRDVENRREEDDHRVPD